VKEQELDLGMKGCNNVAFNGDGKIAVIAGKFS
jgi:hypothetical protein